MVIAVLSALSSCIVSHLVASSDTAGVPQPPGTMSHTLGTVTTDGQSPQCCASKQPPRLPRVMFRGFTEVPHRRRDSPTGPMARCGRVRSSGSDVALCWTGGLRFVPRPSSNRPSQSQHVSVLFYMAETPVDMDPWRRVATGRQVANRWPKHAKTSRTKLNNY